MASLHPLLEQPGVRPLPIPGRWCVHAYYSMCPWAPDGSGRILAAGADLKTGRAGVFVLSPAGEVLSAFGDNAPEAAFFHTGLWQTWSRDSRYVYYQSGSMKAPSVARYDLLTGSEIRLEGADIEGAPPFGEPMLSGLIGQIYAAGYGTGTYLPEEAPVPFAARDRHGLFRYTMEPQTAKLALSVADVLARHPRRDELLKAEEAYVRETGNDGFTLMCYCVRWSPDGERLLFYFGNHCVDKRRGEPKLCYVFTAKKDLTDLHLALDLSFDHRGVHWAWHPDGEHLIGYADHPDNGWKRCLCRVRYDGTDFRMISRHASNGHPSVSPADYDLLVTDEGTEPGRVVFIDLKTDRETGAYTLPRTFGEVPRGRNRHRVCHHPVWRPDGRKVLVNTLPGENAVLCELDVFGR
ncbi:MAG: hypothetical protein II776_00565 [Clostridia bacterium]|nr:hypothetical protein [Clostridia bacterium]